MNTTDIFRDFAQRAMYSLDQLPLLTVEKLNAHPLGHPNSVAWLLWHTGRELDMQLATLTKTPEIWTSKDYQNELNLGWQGDGMGYGQSEADARAIRSDDQGKLADYVRDCLKATIAYADQLADAQWDDIIDSKWNPPVTRGVRLVSIIDDAIQHLAQAHYVAGMPEV